MHLLKQTASAVLGIALLLGVFTYSEASAQSISRYVIGNGGSLVVDGNGTMQFGGTVGQSVVGVGGYEPGAIDIFHGFWYVQSKSSAPTGPVTAGSSLWNSPNPFTTATTIHFDIPSRSTVRLRVYDMDGNLVTTLADGAYFSGAHQVAWDGTNGSGEQVASGYYYYTLDAQPTDQGGQAVSYQQKMLLMK